MRSIVRLPAALALALATSVAGCGVSSTPTPVATPAPTPAPTAVAVANPTPAPTATPTPVPMTDGVGDEHVVGTTTVELTTPYTQTVVGSVIQSRGGVATLTFAMNDARVSGAATYAFSVDIYGVVGSEWGTVSLATDTGAWKGPCSGGSWDTGSRLLLSCWLAGSGAYEGYAYFVVISRPGSGMPAVEGIVYPGEPPAQ